MDNPTDAENWETAAHMVIDGWGMLMNIETVLRPQVQAAGGEMLDYRVEARMVMPTVIADIKAQLAQLQWLRDQGALR